MYDVRTSPDLHFQFQREHRAGGGEGGYGYEYECDADADDDNPILPGPIDPDTKNALPPLITMPPNNDRLAGTTSLSTLLESMISSSSSMTFNDRSFESSNSLRQVSTSGLDLGIRGDGGEKDDSRVGVGQVRMGEGRYGLQSCEEDDEDEVVYRGERV